MQDNITIDGYSLYDTWGITPIGDIFYDPIMQYPDAKDKTVSSYKDEDGIHVVSQVINIKSKDIVLNFGANNYSGYLSFMNYLVNHPNFKFISFEVQKVMELEYLSKSDFHYYPNTGEASFAIKVREANFKNRSPIYLLTENNVNIMTESGISIIL